MKAIKTLSVLAALLMLLPVFASCDKDDDPTEADDIVATYSGSLNYKVTGFDPGIITGTYDLKVMKGGEDDVVVVIPECSFTPPITNARPFTIPSITVNGVKVTTDGETYVFKCGSFSQVIDEKDYEGSNLVGTVKGNNVTVQYQLIPGSMRMPIVFTFTGTKK